MLALHALRPLIERAWSRETTYLPDEWERHDPAWGQCAVTAAMVQQILGGELMMGTARLPDGGETNHFWNRVAGVEVDLTARQFPVGAEIRNALPVSRRRALECAWMLERFMRLQEAVAGTVTDAATARELAAPVGRKR